MPPAPRVTALDQIQQAGELIARFLSDPQAYPWGFWVKLVLLGVFVVIAWRYLMKRLDIVATKKDIAEISELAEAGKNAATKKDIEELTRKVESVKLEFARKIAHFQSDLQFRNVALTKRLEIHQKAFTLMHSLRTDAQRMFPTNDDHRKLRTTYIDWWYENALFLSDQGGKAFTEAVEAVQALWTWQQQFEKTRGRIDPDGMGYSNRSQGAWEKITVAMKALLAGVQLSPELEPNRPMPKKDEGDAPTIPVEPEGQ